MWKLAFKTSWPFMMFGILGVVSNAVHTDVPIGVHVFAAVILMAGILIATRLWIQAMMWVEARRLRREAAQQRGKFSRTIRAGGPLDNTGRIVITPDGEPACDR